MSDNKNNIKNDVYLSENDSKNIPCLKRIELFPDLSEDDFISLKIFNIKENTYKINKKGQILRLKDNKILFGSKNKDGYVIFKFKTNDDKSRNIVLSKLIASVFLFNPNVSIYSIVNHIDHNPENNNLSNLEWVTPATNSNRNSGKSKYIKEEYLVNYIATDNSGNEVFRINSRSNDIIKYKIRSINKSISRKTRYKGYLWKKSIDKSRSRSFLGFSGNLDDYEWFEHWKYPGLYVCKEGFIKRNNKRIGYIKSNGYVFVTISNSDNVKAPVHRVIMEFILKRDLKNEEIVDHINTIKTDNSFSNLRITDSKGNRNNPLTLDKSCKKVILTDIFGDFILCDSIKNVSNFVYSKFQGGILNFDILDNKYFCIVPNDSNSLFKKMRKIIYVFPKNKDKVLGAFTSINSVVNCKNKEIKLSSRSIHKVLKNQEKPAKNGNYYITGDYAIKLLISLGYINSIKRE